MEQMVFISVHWDTEDRIGPCLLWKDSSVVTLGTAVIKNKLNE